MLSNIIIKKIYLAIKKEAFKKTKEIDIYNRNGFYRHLIDENPKATSFFMDKEEYILLEKLMCDLCLEATRKEYFIKFLNDSNTLEDYYKILANNGTTIDDVINNNTMCNFLGAPLNHQWFGTWINEDDKWNDAIIKLNDEYDSKYLGNVY